MADNIQEIKERIECFIGRHLNEGELKLVKCENSNAYHVYGLVLKNRDKSHSFVFCRAEADCPCRLIMVHVPQEIATNIDEAHQEGKVTYIGSIKVEW